MLDWIEAGPPKKEPKAPAVGEGHGGIDARPQCYSAAGLASMALYTLDEYLVLYRQHGIGSASTGQCHYSDSIREFSRSR